MLWALMIIAMFVSILVELVCFFVFKVKNFAVILGLQFLASLGATYATAYSFVGVTEGMSNTLMACIGVSLAIVVLFAVIRYYFGSWYNRRPGPGIK
ncbi:hypothetical protein [Oligoflexus tunisiensis]|uniref:hypothetical protein n=1 Tax=Oligoflexus tunisiensis TaxID=708132 RepID=UPI00114D2160|nr:hypothetical protein [Oligoflexus tunisiensis]